jgi:hypothetical protein
VVDIVARVRPVQINGEADPVIHWELVDKPPGSRVDSFKIMREHLVDTATCYSSLVPAQVTPGARSLSNLLHRFSER